jgi:hypothetical protein
MRVPGVAARFHALYRLGPWYGTETSVRMAKKRTKAEDPQVSRPRNGPAAPTPPKELCERIHAERGAVDNWPGPTKNRTRAVGNPARDPDKPQPRNPRDLAVIDCPIDVDICLIMGPGLFIPD